MGHSPPLSIRSVTAFLDFKHVFVPPQDGSRSISIPIVGFLSYKAAEHKQNRAYNGSQTQNGS